ncbi:MAG: NB-ARC domain-containing protein, partial [Candidatus Eremiobacterota bacterium]
IQLEHLYSVYFTDPNNGWVVGDNGLFYGTILKSTNINWSPYVSRFSSSESLEKLNWYITDSDPDNARCKEVAFSIDNGINWRKIGENLKPKDTGRFEINKKKIEILGKTKQFNHDELVKLRKIIAPFIPGKSEIFRDKNDLKKKLQGLNFSKDQIQLIFMYTGTNEFQFNWNPGKYVLTGAQIKFRITLNDGPTIFSQEIPETYTYKPREIPMWFYYIFIFLVILLLFYSFKPYWLFQIWLFFAKYGDALDNLPLFAKIKPFKIPFKILFDILIIREKVLDDFLRVNLRVNAKSIEDYLKRNFPESLFFLPISEVSEKTIGERKEELFKNIRERHLYSLQPIKTRTMVSIVGKGGLGKTTLAIQLLHNFRKFKCKDGKEIPIIPLKFDITTSNSDDDHSKAIIKTIKTDIFHGTDIPEIIIEALMKNKRIILFVDGLSEKTPGIQDKIIKTLKEEIFMFIMITSRDKRHEEIPNGVFLPNPSKRPVGFLTQILFFQNINNFLNINCIFFFMKFISSIKINMPPGYR